MSKIFVDQVDPKTATTLTLGTSGDTVSIPSGVTIANAGTATGFGVSLANGVDNRVVTSSSTTALNGEANLTFDGSTFTATGTSSLNGAVVINESGADVDFRIEADDTTHMFFVDASEDKIGINQPSPLGIVHVRGGGANSGASVDANADELVLENSGHAGLSILTGTSHTGYIVWGDSGNNAIGRILYNHASNYMRFDTNGSEAMRINDLGQILNNTTSETIGNFTNGARIVTNTANGKDGIYIDNIGVAKTGIGIRKYDASSTCFAMLFKNSANSDIGNITIGGTSTSFNTSSDYRLKENVEYNFDATTRLKQLKPARFNFKEDTDTIVDGFLAHEVSSIIPEAITGEKDAMIPEVLYTDEDELPEGKEIGDVKETERINPQSIDQSKLVPLLTKALQEAITKIEILETENTDIKARLTALENA